MFDNILAEVVLILAYIQQFGVSSYFTERGATSTLSYFKITRNKTAFKLLHFTSFIAELALNFYL